MLWARRGVRAHEILVLQSRILAESLPSHGPLPRHIEVPIGTFSVVLESRGHPLRLHHIAKQILGPLQVTPTACV